MDYFVSNDLQQLSANVKDYRWKLKLMPQRKKYLKSSGMIKKVNIGQMRLQIKIRALYRINRTLVFVL
jgi:hypothetical protein